MLSHTFNSKLKSLRETPPRPFLQRMHIDGLLLSLLIMLSFIGLAILYSASTRRLHTIELQLFRLCVSFLLMILFAQIPPTTLQRFAPWIYAFGLSLLLSVLIIGHIGKGAQRWLSYGIIHFQPAELMKLATPLLLAFYYHRIHLPITWKSIFLPLVILFIPFILTAKQPDLGTAILIASAGGSVFFFAGLSFQLMASFLLGLTFFLPFGWSLLHDYQRQRIWTFFNPEVDPLGKGYHIIQSKIAIGSGGLFGKGWIHGTQSNLHFLPEHSTDFIFAVCGEEFGFIGSCFLITLYLAIVLRSLQITMHAQDSFSRLLAASITCTFFASFFVNMGMVTGILPVVGMPLPLISYGGSSMMTMMASFGILMSIQTHRKLVTT